MRVLGVTWYTTNCLINGERSKIPKDFCRLNNRLVEVSVTAGERNLKRAHVQIGSYAVAPYQIGVAEQTSKVIAPVVGRFVYFYCSLGWDDSYCRLWGLWDVSYTSFDVQKDDSYMYTWATTVQCRTLFMSCIINSRIRIVCEFVTAQLPSSLTF